MYNTTMACTKEDRLTQKALLNLIYDKYSEEVQTLQISDYHGMPDSGYFKIKFQDQITPTIWYSLNYNATVAYFRKAFIGIAEVDVNAVSAARFTVTFKNALNVPLMIVAENALTLGESPAGEIKIGIHQQGGQRNAYSLLKSLPLDQWSIVSYDGRQRIACVAIQSANSWVRKTDTTLQKKPTYLQIQLPPAI